MKPFLETCIPSDDYDNCWEDTVPPYDVFMDFLVTKINASLNEPATDVTCTVRPNGTNRVRVDGLVSTESQRLNLYVELVWLPAMDSFRGTVSLRELEHGEGPIYCGDEDNAAGDLIPVFVPPLVTVLRQMEQRNGGPLSESKVLAIRDSAICIALRPSIAQAMEKSRGYADLNPANCWEEWKAAREAISDASE